MIHVLNYKFNLLKNSNRGMRSAHCVENKFDPLYTVPKSIESQHKTEPIIGFDYIYVHSTGLLHTVFHAEIQIISGIVNFVS